MVISIKSGKVFALLLSSWWDKCSILKNCLIVIIYYTELIIWSTITAIYVTRCITLVNIQNLLTPAILFFALGFLAQLIRSDLKLPSELTKSITIYLLISIGIHGGLALSHVHFSEAIPSISVAILLGIMLPIIAYAIIHGIGKIDHLNAIAIATHYGSVSAGTFLTAVAFLQSMNIEFEKYPVIMLAIMESPAILVGLVMASIARRKLLNNKHDESDEKGDIGLLIREAFTNGSIVLLIGGLIIGDISPEQSLASVLPFFDQLFMGVLCVFLLAMGMEAGKKIADFKLASKFLICFGILMPIAAGLVGVVIGHYVLHFAIGGATLVGVLAASSSYIAVPPAMRMAIPEANPSIYLTLSLGVTFPFNVILGIPIYYSFANTII